MNRYDGIDKRIVSNVKVYARNLKRNSIFRSMDLEDLEQELMCEILSCMNRFDEHCGELEHFVRRVLNRRCLNLLKAYERKKRDSVIQFSEFCDEVGNKDADDVFKRYQDELEMHTEVSRFMDEMPIKYRLLYKLWADHSIVEIAQIFGVSRFAIFRDLKRIAFLLHYLRNSENQFLFLVGRKKMGKNLSAIETLNTKELSQLEVCDLADLSEQVSKLVNHTKELKEKLEDALNLRFSETVQSKLHDENKDTGTTKFYESGFQIVAEVPKKVTWDSDKIDEIIKTISEEKRKAIIKTTHVIDERKYVQLSPEDKSLFADARTVTPGKTKFKISIPEEV
ncbi:MAG: sigma-70 family RNA polymerase sigma factor [Alphaproteobacteria bacterium]|nr:sigma-70 family RNA polymerase sigma factor [Alphaproteobacteria bacterium]